MSAVSTNSIDCLSKKLIICCWDTYNSSFRTIHIYCCNKYKLTADLSTFDAELAHFTSANKRMNNCLVRAEKLYISILRSRSVFRGSLKYNRHETSIETEFVMHIAYYYDSLTIRPARSARDRCVAQ